MTAWLSRQTSPGTRRAYKLVTVFLADVAKEAGIPVEAVLTAPLRDVVPAHQAWINNALERRSLATVKRYLTTLSSYYTYLMAMGYRETNPAAMIRMPRLYTDDQHRPVWTLEEAERIRTELTYAESPVVILRGLAAFDLMLGCGLRRTEVVTLRMGDINLVNRTVSVRGKRGKPRTVSISRRAHESLSAYLQELSKHCPRGRADDVFVSSRSYTRITKQSLTRTINRACQHARVETLGSCHTLRRTFATEAYRRGATLEQLRITLGHEDIRTTARYVQVEESTVVLDLDN